MRNITFLVGCALCSTATGVASANTPPAVVDETISASDASWVALVKPATGLAMGKFRIRFEDTALSEVLSAVGSGQIQQQGDAADNVYWLCYTASTAGKQARIWIQASGEMGGPEHRITDLAVESVREGAPPSDCPKLSKAFQLLTFNNGVWLGSPAAAVDKVFSHGLLRTGDKAFVGYHGKVAGDGRCSGGYDLLNGIHLTFQREAVVAIDASQVTSC